jgi:hypothetical protein
MPTKIVSDTPISVPDPIDFFKLRSLDEVAALRPFVERCETIGAEINALDRQIPLAATRFSALWHAFQAPSFVVGTTPTQEDVTVTEAKRDLEALQEQRKALAAHAVIARADLAAATGELRAELMPGIRQQLDGPITVVIRGFEAALSVERLFGAMGSYAQARALVNAILVYLRDVRGLLEDKDDA